MNQTALEPQVKMNIFTRSWLLTKSAWQVLRADKELALLPLIGMLAGVIITLAMVAALFAGLVIGAQETSTGFTSDGSWTYVATVIVGSLLIGLVSNFIGGAMVHGVIERLKGGDPTVRSSLAGARRKFKGILFYSIFTGVVGLVVQYLIERVPFIAKFFVWIGGTAFNIATFFALPYIISDNNHTGPIDATKKSIGLIKKVWGESLVISVGVGIAGMLIGFGYSSISLLVIAGMATISTAAAAITGLITLFGLIAIVFIFSLLSAIAKTAIFYWATTGKEPAAFSKDVLRQTFTPKKARKLFV